MTTVLTFPIFSGMSDTVSILTGTNSTLTFPPDFFIPEATFIVSLSWFKAAVNAGCMDDLMNGVVGVLYSVDRSCRDSMEESMQEAEEGSFLESDDRLSSSEYGVISLTLHTARPAVINGSEPFLEGDIAFISESMFFTALKWHHDKVEMESILPGEGSAFHLFSLASSIYHDTAKDHFVIRFLQEGDEEEFTEAYRILFSKPGKMQVWDFSGNIQERAQSTILDVPLQICGLSFPVEVNENDMVEEAGVNIFEKLLPKIAPSSEVCYKFYPDTCLGLTGLYNAGNTCYMNSALQCLVHTPKFLDYFLGNFRKDVKKECSSKTRGNLAITFGSVLRNIWTPGTSAASASMLKDVVSSFAPAFAGQNQNDSQEFLSVFLGGLHEELNRAKRMSCVLEANGGDGRPDEIVGDEFWKAHISCNDSIVTDLFQGQFRSTVSCAVCKYSSRTFDPFMHLSLPLQSSRKRKMCVMVFNTDGNSLPHPYGVQVPEFGTLKDLVKEIGVACCLRDNEVLLFAEIYMNRVARFLENPSSSLVEISDSDKIVAYRLQKDDGESHRVILTHRADSKQFGIPIVTTISNCPDETAMRETFLNIIRPFLYKDEDSMDEDDDAAVAADGDVWRDVSSSSSSCSSGSFKKGAEIDSSSMGFEISMDKSLSSSSDTILVTVRWSEELIHQYDILLLSQLPVICLPMVSPMDGELHDDSPISLYKCVETFLKEDRLVSTNMWFCPVCKERREADKKLDLWRLPEVLIVHLKRFFYNSRTSNTNKLNAFVDFPVADFDLSDYLAARNDGDGKLRHNISYKLYGIVNHYGNAGGGHYTAFVKGKKEKWYEFNDAKVSCLGEYGMVTPAAYVLFYRRKY